MENPSYPQVPQPPPPPLYVAQTSTLAIVSLIAGILSWIGFLFIGPIVAIITGHMAKSEIKKSNGMITGSGMATAGLVLGYINIGLCVLGLCAALAFFALGLLSIPFLNQVH